MKVHSFFFFLSLRQEEESVSWIQKNVVVVVTFVADYASASAIVSYSSIDTTGTNIIITLACIVREKKEEGKCQDDYHYCDHCCCHYINTGREKSAHYKIRLVQSGPEAPKDGLRTKEEIGTQETE